MTTSDLPSCAEPHLDSFEQSFAAANYTRGTLKNYRSLVRRLALKGESALASCRADRSPGSLPARRSVARLPGSALIMLSSRMVEAQQTSRSPRPCGIIRITALWVLCRYRHKTHWTGHKKRLDRDLTARFGENAYAMEELVAELGAAFLCADLGVTNSPRPDHAAYVGNWIRVLGSYPRALFLASARAGAAVDYLTGLQPGPRSMTS